MIRDLFQARFVPAVLKDQQVTEIIQSNPVSAKGFPCSAEASLAAC